MRIGEFACLDLVLGVTEQGEALRFRRSVVEPAAANLPRHLEAEASAILNGLLKEGERRAEWTYDHDDGTIFRVRRIPSRRGVWYVLRKIAGDLPALDDLGIDMNLLRSLIALGRGSGLMTIGAPPGHGKSTLASVLLVEMVKAYARTAYAVEDPPEYPVEGFHQGPYGDGQVLQLHPDQYGGWREAINATLRGTGNILFLGEVRTPEVAYLALELGLSNFVMCTIHAGSIGETLTRFAALASERAGETVPAGMMLADTLKAALHLRMQTRPSVAGQASRMSPVVKHLFPVKTDRHHMRENQFHLVVPQTDRHQV